MPASPSLYASLLSSGTRNKALNSNDYIARMLMEQGMDNTPIQSPFQGFARLAQAYAGKRMEDKNAEAAAQGNQALADILAPPTDTVTNGPQQTVPMQPQQPPQGPQPSMPQMPPAGTDARVAQGVDPTLSFQAPQISTTVDPRNAQIAELLNGGIGQGEFAKQAMARLGFGGEDQYDPTPRYDQNGNAYIVGKTGSVKPLEGIKARDKLEAQTNGVVWNPYQGTEMGRLTDTMSPEAQAQKAAIAAAGKPVTSVSVSADKSFGTSLGDNTANILKDSHAAAQSATQTIDASRQVLSALDAPGGVSAGPGASFGQFLNQVSGGDPKKVANTRNVIQGMARLTVGARSALKGQGQVSDYEGKLLQRAASGDIDSMTTGEIRIVAQVADRLARQQIKLNSENVGRARKLPGAPQGMVDFYEVPEPPPYQSPSVAAPRSSGRFHIEEVK